jgi:hypothetical protein
VPGLVVAGAIFVLFAMRASAALQATAAAGDAFVRQAQPYVRDQVLAAHWCDRIILRGSPFRSTLRRGMRRPSPRIGGEEEAV